MEQSGIKDNKSAFQQVIIMFMGEYSHTIDAKGRMSIPAKYREELGESFVVTKGLDGCLFVYDMDEWKVLEEKLKSLPMTHKDTRKLTRFFLAGATLAELDKQGRILLPVVLREFAAITKDVVLLGVGNRIEIWSKEVWEQQSDFEDMDDIAEHMAELGLNI